MSNLRFPPIHNFPLISDNCCHQVLLPLPVKICKEIWGDYRRSLIQLGNKVSVFQNEWGLLSVRNLLIPFMINVNEYLKKEAEGKTFNRCSVRSFVNFFAEIITFLPVPFLCKLKEFESNTCMVIIKSYKMTA